MAVTQYIGARYVPLFYTASDNSNDWESGVIYDPLTIVTYLNQSYTSKIPVPASVGNPADNPDYWILTGGYNAQVEQYRTEVELYKQDVDTLREETAKIYWKTPEEYGAVGDGVTDDSAAIQALFNAAAPGDTLVFTAYKYLCDTPLTVPASAHNIKIVGGFDKSEFAPTLYTTINSGSFITIYSAGIGMNNICIQGSGKNNNVTLLEFDSDNTTSDGNIDAILQMIALFGASVGLATKGRNCRVSDSVFSTLNIGAQFNKMSSRSDHNRGYHISDNRFHDVDLCIKNDIDNDNINQNIFITNNFCDFSAQLFRGYGGGLFINGNDIDAVGSAISSGAVIVEVLASSFADNVQRSLISNNKFIGWAARTVACVMIEANNSVEVIVSGNTCSNANGFGVGIKSNAKAIVNGNTFINCGESAGYYAVNPVDATCAGVIANNIFVSCTNTIRTSSMTTENNITY